MVVDSSATHVPRIYVTLGATPLVEPAGNQNRHDIGLMIHNGMTAKNLAAGVAALNVGETPELIFNHDRPPATHALCNQYLHGCSRQINASWLRYSACQMRISVCHYAKFGAETGQRCSGQLTIFQLGEDYWNLEHPI